MRLWSKSETEYETPEAGAVVDVKLAQQGYASQFVLRQDGGSFEFVRQD